jgi:septum formation protein
LVRGHSSNVLVLASNSPRRQQILSDAGFRYLVRPPGIPEEPYHGEKPDGYVRRLAEEKAFAVPLSDGEIVLAADTVVVAQGALLEKPRDHADAARMLGLLSGREHEVITGICIRTASEKIVDAAITRVRFVALSKPEIGEYVASGEPMDKAGAYAIQGLASKFINRIEGCYFNVVGLPIALVYQHLKQLGYSPELQAKPPA